MPITSLAEFPTSLKTGFLSRTPTFRQFGEELGRGGFRRTDYWRYGRWEFGIDYGVIDNDFLLDLENFRHGVKGHLTEFLFQDWTRPDPDSEVIGVGDGTRRLFKIWGDSFSSVTAFVNGVPAEIFSWDPDTGYILLTVAPADGALVTASITDEKFRVIFLPAESEIQNLGGQAYAARLQFIQAKHVESPTTGFPTLAPAPGGPGQIYVNSFTPFTSPGAQTITGLPWTPGVLVFWATGATVEDTFQNTVFAMHGFAAPATLENAAIAAATLDGVTTVTGARRNDNAHCILFIDTAGTVIAEAAVTGVGPGTFTLTWTTTSWPGGTPMLVQYLAISDDDILDADIVNWTMPTSGTRVVTGLSFRPDVVLHLYLPITTIPTTTTPTVSIGLGGMSRDGTQFSMWTTVGTGFGGATDRQSDSHLFLDRIVQITDPVGGSFGALNYVSMDSGGFTVQVGPGGGPAANYQVMSLCLRGCRHRFAAFQKRTITGLQAITGAGYQTFGWWWLTNNGVSGGGANTNRHFTGAADGTRQRSGGFIDDNQGVGVTAAPRHRMSSGQTGGILTATPALVAEADYVSFDTDGFTVNWPLNNGDGTPNFLVWFIGPGVMA